MSDMGIFRQQSYNLFTQLAEKPFAVANCWRSSGVLWRERGAAGVAPMRPITSRRLKLRLRVAAFSMPRLIANSSRELRSQEQTRVALAAPCRNCS